MLVTAYDSLMVQKPRFNIGFWLECVKCKQKKKKMILLDKTSSQLCLLTAGLYFCNMISPNQLTPNTVFDLLGGGGGCSSVLNFKIPDNWSYAPWLLSNHLDTIVATYSTRIQTSVPIMLIVWQVVCLSVNLYPTYIGLYNWSIQEPYWLEISSSPTLDGSSGTYFLSHP